MNLFELGSFNILVVLKDVYSLRVNVPTSLVFFEDACLVEPGGFKMTHRPCGCVCFEPENINMIDFALVVFGSLNCDARKTFSFV